MEMKTTRRLAEYLCLLLCCIGGSAVSWAQEGVDELPPPAVGDRRTAGDRAGLVGLTWSLPAQGEGVVVLRVIADGAAAEAGLRTGDVLRVIDGRPVRGIQDAVDLLVPGKRVNLQYERAGRLWTTVLQVPKRSIAAAPLPPPARNPLPAGPAIRPMLGVTVKKVGTKERIELGIPQDVRGLLITRVRQGTPAARYGLPIGGVILDVDGAVMSTPDDLIALVRGAKLDRPMVIRYWHREQTWRKRVTLAPEVLVPDSVLELEKQLELPPPESGSPSAEVVELRRRVEMLELQVKKLIMRLDRLEQHGN